MKPPRSRHSSSLSLQRGKGHQVRGERFPAPKPGKICAQEMRDGLSSYPYPVMFLPSTQNRQTQKRHRRPAVRHLKRARRHGRGLAVFVEQTKSTPKVIDDEAQNTLCAASTLDKTCAPASK